MFARAELDCSNLLVGIGEWPHVLSNLHSSQTACILYGKNTGLMSGTGGTGLEFYTGSQSAERQ